MPKKKREEFPIRVTPYGSGLKEYIERLQSILDNHKDVSDDLVIDMDVHLEYYYDEPDISAEVVITKESKNV